MKRIKWILFTALLVSAMAGNSQVASKDEMIKKIFSVHKNKDEDGFVKLFPDVSTLKAFMTKLADRDASGEIQEMMSVLFDDLTDSGMQAKLRKDFQRTIKKGEQKGVVWKDAVFASCTSDSTVDKEEGMGASKLNGKIYFTQNSKEYFLEFDDIILFDKGWYGVEVRRVDERTKENDIADETGEVLDEVKVAVDSVMVDPPKVKPPLKTQKQPVKPQSKTQTPAKNP